MEQVGLVRRLDGNKMELEVRRISGCGGGCSSCGGGCDSEGHSVIVSNRVNAKVGDVVEIKGDSNKILKLTALVYIIPLVFLVMGIGISSSILKSQGNEAYEILSLGIGIVALAVSFLVLKAIDKKVTASGEEALTVTRIL